MRLNYNSRGFLYETITLPYAEFEFHFGINPRRIEQLNNALSFFRITWPGLTQKN